MTSEPAYEHNHNHRNVPPHPRPYLDTTMYSFSWGVPCVTAATRGLTYEYNDGFGWVDITCWTASELTDDMWYRWPKTKATEEPKFNPQFGARVNVWDTDDTDDVFERYYVTSDSKGTYVVTQDTEEAFLRGSPFTTMLWDCMGPVVEDAMDIPELSREELESEIASQAAHIIALDSMIAMLDTEVGEQEKTIDNLEAMLDDCEL